jgi:hypothetical protein
MYTISPKTKQKQNKAEQKQSKTETKRKQIGLFFFLLLPPSMCMLQAFPGSRCVLENTFNAIQAERQLSD